MPLRPYGGGSTYRMAYGNPLVATGQKVSGAGDYARLMGQIERQDRAHEIAMRELEYLAARQALGLGIPGQTQGGSANANAFLQKWEQQLGKAEGVFNQALAGLGGVYDDLRTASGAAMKLGDLAGRVEQEYQGFQQQFQPLQQEMAGLATEEAGMRRQLMAELPALTAYDPEAAAGRAIAGVAQQFGQARQATAGSEVSIAAIPSLIRDCQLG